MVGGVEQVILGDMAAAKNDPSSSAPRKLIAQRAGPPTFDVIVEVQRGCINEWNVTLDAADAVDKVLNGDTYEAQRRTRLKDGSAMWIRKVQM
jgi:hypothetical protein